MCTDRITRSIVAEHDLLAYKLVRQFHNQYKSWSEPEDRSPEQGIAVIGANNISCYSSVKIYGIGVEETSGRPGMYCYRDLGEAQKKQNQYTPYNRPNLLMVKIPRGSRLYEGFDGGQPVLLVEKLIPLMEIK